VASGSRAAQNGLRPGDVLTATSAGQGADLASLRASLAEPPRQLVPLIPRGDVRGRRVPQQAPPARGRTPRAGPAGRGNAASAPPHRRTQMTPTSTENSKENLSEAGVHLKSAAGAAGEALRGAATAAGDELRLGKANVKAELADTALSGLAAAELGGEAARE